MLISLLLILEADRPGVLPLHVGRANYAVTLARLNGVAAGLGDAIHALEGFKPLTCSGLFAIGHNEESVKKAGRQTEFQTVVRSGDRFQVHVTGLTPQVSSALVRGFVEATPATWSVSGYTFRVVKTLYNAEVDPWTGCTSYEALAARPILQGGAFAPQVTLTFLSPTSFQSNNLHMPLPLPNLVFGSLADRWNHFSPLIKMPGELRTQLLERVAISQYELRSQAVQQKRGADGGGRGATPLHIGAEGFVTYTLLSRQEDPHQFVELTSKLQTLANFAMYSGVGVKTTTGMGQCRRVIYQRP
jgi:CRISPR-associated endoribonuclease Cas6